MMILSFDVVVHSLIRNGECEAYQNHVAARNLSGRAFNIDITNDSASAAGAQVGLHLRGDASALDGLLDGFAARPFVQECLVARAL